MKSPRPPQTQNKKTPPPHFAETPQSVQIYAETQRQYRPETVEQTTRHADLFTEQDILGLVPEDDDEVTDLWFLEVLEEIKTDCVLVDFVYGGYGRGKREGEDGLEEPGNDGQFGCERRDAEAAIRMVFL